MATIEQQDTPSQKGVGYESGELPTFETASIIPVGDACTMKEIAEVEKSKNHQAQTDNIGTNDHGVSISGDFKITASTDIPNIGDIISSDEDTARYFVIVTDVEVSGYSKGGKPLMIKFDAEYWPAVHAAENAE